MHRLQQMEHILVESHIIPVINPLDIFHSSYHIDS